MMIMSVIVPKIVLHIFGVIFTCIPSTSDVNVADVFARVMSVRN